MAYQFEPRKEVNPDVKTDIPGKRPDPVKQPTATSRESCSWCLCRRCVVMPSKWNVFVAENLVK